MVDLSVLSGVLTWFLKGDTAEEDMLISRFKFRFFDLKERSLSEAFSALQSKAACTLTTNEFLHLSPEAPRTIQARDPSTSEGRNYYQGI